jgi:hypothetical protein
VLAFTAAWLWLGAPGVPAATVVWSGAGEDLNWSNPANWSNNIPPAGRLDDLWFLGGDFPLSTNSPSTVNHIANAPATIGTLNYLALVPSYHTTLIPEGQTLWVVGAKINTIGTYTSSDAVFVGSGVDSGGTLQGADDLDGPWTDIPGATSPYCVPASEARRFYRARP